MRNWFKRKKSHGKALAFVDYEYWFYSYKNKYGIRPDVGQWKAQLEQEYDLVDLYIFADFASAGLGEELRKLKAITDKVTDTGTIGQRMKKDMTDFIMLDEIYQSAVSRRGIDTFILFTGDGHFQSVVRYLIHKLGKRVVIYGVTETFSRSLQAAATETLLLPLESELYTRYREMILQDLAHCSKRYDIIPTFLSTIDAVVNRYGAIQEHTRRVLQELIDEGYVYQKEQKLRFGKTIKALATDWERLIKEGIWDPERQA